MRAPRAALFVLLAVAAPRGAHPKAPPATQAPATAAPDTPAPGTLAPDTPAPAPATHALATPAPATLAPATALPSTPAPGTALPSTPAPGTASPPASPPCRSGAIDERGCNTCVCGDGVWVCTDKVCRSEAGEACQGDGECVDGLSCRPDVEVSGLCMASKVCKAPLPRGAPCGGVVAPCYENTCEAGLACTAAEGASVRGECAVPWVVTPPPVAPPSECGAPLTCPEGQCYHPELCACGEHPQNATCTPEACSGVRCDKRHKCLVSECGGCRAVCVPDDAQSGPTLALGVVCAKAAAVADLFAQGGTQVSSEQCAGDLLCLPRPQAVSVRHAVDHTCACHTPLQCPPDQCFHPQKCQCGAFSTRTCVNPCVRASHCGRGFICRPNFCGGCHAMCVADVVHRSDADYCLWGVSATQPWTREQRDYCCDTDDMRCPSEAFVAGLQQCVALAASSDLKSAACCAKYGIACHGDKYQCFGTDASQEAWGPGQAEWCCRHRNVCAVQCDEAAGVNATGDCCRVLGRCGAVAAFDGVFAGRNYSAALHHRKVSMKFAGREDLGYTVALFENPAYLLRVVRRAILASAASIQPRNLVVRTIGVMTSEGRVPPDHVLDRWVWGYDASQNDGARAEEEAARAARRASATLEAATPAPAAAPAEEMYFVAEVLSDSLDEVQAMLEDVRGAASAAEQARPGFIPLQQLQLAHEPQRDVDVAEEFLLAVPFACLCLLVFICCLARGITYYREHQSHFTPARASFALDTPKHPSSSRGLEMGAHSRSDRLHSHLAPITGRSPSSASAVSGVGPGGMTLIRHTHSVTIPDSPEEKCMSAKGNISGGYPLLSAASGTHDTLQAHGAPLLLRTATSMSDASVPFLPVDSPLQPSRKTSSGLL